MASLEQSNSDLCISLLKLLIRESISLDKNLIDYQYKNKKFKNLYEIIKKLSLIPESIIIQNIKRQRLLFFFKKNKFLKELLPNVSKEIDFLFKKEIYSCLNEASVTRELSLFLNDNGIKHIFLKGIPLSLQTTNSIIGRGASKDIDLLIQPFNLIKTVEILQRIGFNIPLLNKPYIDKSICGEFSRFMNNELTLYRNKDSSNPILLILTLIFFNLSSNFSFSLTVKIISDNSKLSSKFFFPSSLISLLILVSSTKTALLNF